MTLEVIGAGFGRTGTNSLKLALEQLGYAPCHHMYELARHPEELPLWEARARGEAVDWRWLFARYRAQCDWPGALYWRELAEVFPEARVILTTRDMAAWHRSMAKTIIPSLASRDARPTEWDNRRARHNHLTLMRLFENRIDDPAQAIAVHEAHIAEVRATIPPERLLVFDVSQGWGPLCAHLGLPVPDAPFPRSNDSETFNAIIRDAGQGGD